MPVLFKYLRRNELRLEAKNVLLKSTLRGFIQNFIRLYKEQIELQNGYNAFLE